MHVIWRFNDNNQSFYLTAIYRHSLLDNITYYKTVQIPNV